MVNERGAAVATLLVASMVAGAGVLVSCKKKGSVDADAGADAALVASADAGGSAPHAPAAGAPATTDGPQLRPPLAPESAPPPVAAIAGFGGSYRCPKGTMQLVQSGTIVTSTMRGKTGTETVIACTASRDTCNGSIREIQTVRGKPPKVTHVRDVRLSRASNGDVSILVSDPKERPASCKKQ